MIESNIVYGGKNFKGQPTVTIISIHGVYNVYKMFWVSAFF